ncbi:hypothetical protein L227DRAFT_354145 [Lentinus tigrinus ALCF2SS1-6]|uniref:Uncharacterized protein n=1 Tax=Lentinus tigrinus ALCF2SS1-6 TaxID=1328759 RepID=A0A5C2RV97_9APHY|nr:hypothetical protein L227DRAFT_354145 [Lentinus tigrinus ALCF2SS1-6]
MQHLSASVPVVKQNDEVLRRMGREIHSLLPKDLHYCEAPRKAPSPLKDALGLVEVQRWQEVMMESELGCWAAAGAMDGDASTLIVLRVIQGLEAAPKAEGIYAWFAIEPAGTLTLRLSFVKENVRKRPLDPPGGLNCQGVIGKKDEVDEMNGHKSVQRQFYQIILCAPGNSFLLYAKTVHAPVEDDAEKIKQCIPHRFESVNNSRRLHSRDGPSPTHCPVGQHGSACST